MAKIKRMDGRLGHERLKIKQFKTAEAMHKWLNKQDNNDWALYDGPLKPGTYARAGGEWHNVKGMDPSLLAHC